MRARGRFSAHVLRLAECKEDEIRFLRARDCSRYISFVGIEHSCASEASYMFSADVLRESFCQPDSRTASGGSSIGIGRIVAEWPDDRDVLHCVAQREKGLACHGLILQQNKGTFGGRLRGGEAVGMVQSFGSGGFVDIRMLEEPERNLDAQNITNGLVQFCLRHLA